MSKADLISCSDCGGYDIEWMYRCDKHGCDYCRGCSCPGCEDDSHCDDDDYFEDEEPWDFECGQTGDGGCMLAGTEDCDFECPYRSELYKKSTAK